MIRTSMKNAGQSSGCHCLAVRVSQLPWYIYVYKVSGYPAPQPDQYFEFRGSYSTGYWKNQIENEFPLHLATILEVPSCWGAG